MNKLCPTCGVEKNRALFKQGSPRCADCRNKPKTVTLPLININPVKDINKEKKDCLKYMLRYL